MDRPLMETPTLYWNPGAADDPHTRQGFEQKTKKDLGDI